MRSFPAARRRAALRSRLALADSISIVSAGVTDCMANRVAYAGEHGAVRVRGRVIAHVNARAAQLTFRYGPPFDLSSPSRPARATHWPISGQAFVRIATLAPMVREGRGVN